MNVRTGQVFSLARDNPPLPGCTTSKALCQRNGTNAFLFSLASHTDISAEVYDYRKLISVEAGTLAVHDAAGGSWPLAAGESLCTPLDTPLSMSTESGCVYTEIEIGKDATMNKTLREGAVFKLTDLLPYQDGAVVNLDLVHNDAMKLVLMSFDAGTGLSEHAAPGEALVCALEGQGVIGYEGEEHPIKAGESFAFAKGGKHFVKADGRFKMALLVTLDR